MDMQPRLTAKAECELDEQFRLQHEALDIFKLVVAEWESDPMSVQCFDLRIVEKAKLINARLKKINVLY